MTQHESNITRHRNAAQLRITQQDKLKVNVFDDQDPLESGTMCSGDSHLCTSQALYCYLADVSKSKPDHQKLKKTNQTKKLGRILSENGNYLDVRQK